MSPRAQHALRCDFARAGRRCALGSLTLALTACSSGGESPALGPSGSAGMGGASALSVPFAVDDHFSRSGYMGDAIDGSLDEDGSCLTRAEGAQGLCHAFQIASGTEGWSGLYWLAGDGNWGQRPGLAVAPSARQVSFLAASTTSEPFEFFVGGVSSPGAEHEDGFKASVSVSLSTQWQRLTIDLGDADYDAVLGAFGWSTAHAPTVLYLDDIRWQ